MLSPGGLAEMIPRNIPLSHLIDFLVVTRCGSINKAAELLHVTQPALTRSIKRLEDQLGVPLLVRTPTGIAPTDFGRTLVPYLQKIEGQLRQGLSDIDALRGMSSGRIAFGTTTTFGQQIIPAALGRFLQHWPRLSVEVMDGVKATHLEHLRSGRLDFVLAPISVVEQEPDLLQEELFTDSIGIMARAGNPICQKRDLTLHDLLPLSWVIPSQGTQLRPRLENVFRNEGLELPPFVVEMGAPTLVKRLILTTDRIGSMNRIHVKPELLRGELIELEGSWRFIHCPFGVFTRKGVSLAPAVKELILNIKSAIREFDLHADPA
jgi:DNA-binding transcriptional LysR family regulator